MKLWQYLCSWTCHIWQVRITTLWDWNKNSISKYIQVACTHVVLDKWKKEQALLQNTEEEKSSGQMSWTLLLPLINTTDTINKVRGNLLPTTALSHFLPETPRLAMSESISQLCMPQLILISHNLSHSILILSFGMFFQLEQQPAWWQPHSYQSWFQNRDLSLNGGISSFQPATC